MGEMTEDLLAEEEHLAASSIDSRPSDVTQIVRSRGHGQMKKRTGELVAVAVGNHMVGYNGKVVQMDADGRERTVSPECDHRHKTTSAARTCAALRKVG